MTASTWIELVAVLVGGGGGGAAISKITRMVIAVENLTEQIKEITKGQKETAAVVQNHEVRLAQGGL